LDDLMHAEAIRISMVDAGHPLAIREVDGKTHDIAELLPRKLRSHRTLRPAEVSGIFPLPPKLSKDDAAKAHTELRASLPDTTIWAYSDGSRGQCGKTGAGWAVYAGSRLIAEGSASCGLWREVADAEALAAREAVRAAASAAPPNSSDLRLCIDNYSVASRIASSRTRIGTSQHEIDEVRRTIASWKGGRANPTGLAMGHVQWVPGHKNVLGNVRADELANVGRESTVCLVDDNTMSLASAKRWRKKWLSDQFTAWWAALPKRPHLPRKLCTPIPWNVTWLKPIGRPTLSHILAARSGHGDFKAYHRRFGHDNAEETCTRCQDEKTPTHPWTCKAPRRKLSERFVLKALPENKAMGWLAKLLAEATDDLRASGR
jgi:ribonuclease HI